MKSSQVIAGVGLVDRARKSAWPARMDLAESASGLLVGLFMWGHMSFVSCILISKDSMWTATKALGGYYFFGRAFPQIVSVIVAIVALLDQGVFGCMSLLACHDLCPKELPLQTQIAFLRRKMVVAGLT